MMNTACIPIFALLFFSLSNLVYAQAHIDSHTVALWHFDEGQGNILHDASPYHNDGEVHNASWTAGKFGGGLHFNGKTSYVKLVNSPSLQLTGDFTLEAWISLDTLQFDYIPLPERPQPIILSNLGHYPYGGGYQFGMVEEGFYFDYRCGGDPPFRYTGFTPIPRTHTFYHVAAVYREEDVNGNIVVTVKTYLNGTLGDSSVFSVPVHYFETPFFYLGTNIGGRALGQVGVHEFPGIMDEIRISNIARGPDEFGSTSIVVSDDNLRFGLVRLGESVKRTLTVYNTSFTETVYIDSITSSAGVFTADPVTTSMPPVTSQKIEVTYSPIAATSDSGDLVLWPSNQGLAPIIIGLFGKGLDLGPAPVINTILDIPEDQGKQVRITWYPSQYDAEGESDRVTEYSVWRRVEGSWPKEIPDVDEGKSMMLPYGDRHYIVEGGELWDYVTRIPAVRFSQYAYIASTLWNANVFGIRWSVFRVAAHASAGEFYFSDADSGFSLDNIFPPPPLALRYTIDPHGVMLRWDYTGDGDTQQYNVYRSVAPTIVASDHFRIGHTTEAGYYDPTIDPDSTYYYVVTAVDSSGNESVESNRTMGVHLTDIEQAGGVPEVFILEQNYPNPFNPRTVIRYGLPERSRVTLEIYNLIGQRVATVVDGIIDPGYHTATWHGERASGVYVYRIFAVGLDRDRTTFAATGKMVLMK